MGGFYRVEEPPPGPPPSPHPAASEERRKHLSIPEHTCPTSESKALLVAPVGYRQNTETLDW